MHICLCLESQISEVLRFNRAGQYCPKTKHSVGSGTYDKTEEKCLSRGCILITQPETHVKGGQSYV